MSDSSIFDALFNLPHVQGMVVQGSSDEEPIIFHDEATHFRALFWALYSTYVESFNFLIHLSADT